MKSKVKFSARRKKGSLILALAILVLSCASQHTAEGEGITPEEYQVINDFYERVHLPLYHRTVSSSLSSSFSDYDSISTRKRYPERTREFVLENLLPPTTLQEIQEKFNSPEEVYFEEQYLRNIRLTGKKRNSFAISRPIVVDSIAIIRQTGVTNNPVFMLKKESDGHWGLRYTFFEKTNSE